MKKRKCHGKVVEEQPCPLSLLLLQDFAQGRLAAKKVQAIAEAAVRSGCLIFDYVNFEVTPSHHMNVMVQNPAHTTASSI